MTLVNDEDGIISLSFSFLRNRLSEIRLSEFFKCVMFTQTITQRRETQINVLKLLYRLNQNGIFTIRRIKNV